MTSPNPIYYLSKGQLLYSTGHNKQFQVTYNSTKGMEDNQDVKLSRQPCNLISLVV